MPTIKEQKELIEIDIEILLLKKFDEVSDNFKRSIFKTVLGIALESMTLEQLKRWLESWELYFHINKIK